MLNPQDNTSQMARPQQIKVAAPTKQELFKHRKLFGQLTLSYSCERNTSPAAQETQEENIPGMLLGGHACSSARRVLPWHGPGAAHCGTAVSLLQRPREAAGQAPARAEHPTYRGTRPLSKPRVGLLPHTAL